MKFTIIVPIYNVEKYLEKCINSILIQDYKIFELILVDDGSSDYSSYLCDIYAAKDNRITVIHKKNGGVVSARKKGVDVATGEYVLFVDADDWIHSSLLDELARVICQNHLPDMVLFDAQRVYEDRMDKMIQNLESGYYDRIKIEQDIVPYMLYDKRQPFLTALIAGQMWNKAFKLELLREHICTDVEIYRSEDFACVYECIYYADSLYYLNKNLYYYNKTNANSAVSIYDSSYFRNLCKVITYVSEHLGCQAEVLQKQINANYVSGICIGVFHLMRCGKGLKEAAEHLREELETTGCLSDVDCTGLPAHAHLYIFLLKRKLYLVTLMITKIYLRFKK